MSLVLDPRDSLHESRAEPPGGALGVHASIHEDRTLEGFDEGGQRQVSFSLLEECKPREALVLDPTRRSRPWRRF